ncbi:MAG TPA: cell division protein FtsQ/DivIB [Edaphocola sp.]|nr:cell division protein FtsQ/DivIB [Edaphocola sp.]
MSNNNTSKIGKAKSKIGIVLFLLAFGALLVAANNRQDSEPVKDVLVTLKNQGITENFLRKEDVAQLIKNQGINIENKVLSNIDLDQIENIVGSNKWVKDVDAFVDNNNKLNIEVTQRIPDARIFDKNGNSFYIDETGFEMPLSDRYAYAIPVFTNYSKAKNDSDAVALKQRIVFLGKLIQADSFWNAQISQIVINNAKDFSFYTTLGNQEVKFGDTTSASEKLENLFSFYKQVSNKIGWDRYQVLDARFKGQVVATPSLGWIPPKDTVKVEAVSVLTEQTQNIKKESLPEEKQKIASPKVDSEQNNKKQKPKNN